MSEVGLELGHARRHRRRRGLGCLAVLIALVVLLGAAYAAYTFGYSALKDSLAPPPDYAGPGTGSVTIQVKQGDAAGDIAATLVHHDVVKSQKAFTDAAVDEPLSRTIQVGYYEMKHKMPAKAALAVLVDPDNATQQTVTLPEGWTVHKIVARLAASTDFSAKQYTKVLAKPATIGLPGYAHSHVEGYLFPATYTIRPDATPTSILERMVDRFKQEADTLHLEANARQLGRDPQDVVTVASLVQAEARNDGDFGKVSRVIYNRLARPLPLQFDSTIHYVLKRDGKVSTSREETKIKSPYNTYRHNGLPPTPIMAPGEKALRAALQPPKGDWLYFVTTNPGTGRTKFTHSYREFLRFKAEYKHYCATSDAC